MNRDRKAVSLRQNQLPIQAWETRDEVHGNGTSIGTSSNGDITIYMTRG
jgi:hypothetical protein